MLESDDFVIHPHKYVKRNNPSQKHFIFDLDETLGSFSDLHVLWRGLHHINETKDISFTGNQFEFNKIMDLFPEFLRYGILTILEFLKYKKRENKCGKIYIYTNNQCPPPWVEFIANYIESKKNMKGLFERPICAFKIKNTVLEKTRTTHEKTMRDFIKCSLLPRNAEICFVDNSYHPKMNSGSIFYIQPKSYYHSLSINDIIRRLSTSNFIKSYTDEIYRDLETWFSNHVGFSYYNKKTKDEEEIDIAVSRKLMYTIKEFFYFSMKKSNTKRRFTAKKRHTSKNLQV